VAEVKHMHAKCEDCRCKRPMAVQRHICAYCRWCQAPSARVKQLATRMYLRLSGKHACCCKCAVRPTCLCGLWLVVLLELAHTKCSNSLADLLLRGLGLSRRPDTRGVAGECGRCCRSSTLRVTLTT